MTNLVGGILEMANVIRPVKIRYRVCEGADYAVKGLEVLVRAALNTNSGSLLKSWKSRVYQDPKGPGRSILLSHVWLEKKYVIGKIMTYTEGEGIAAITTNKDGASPDVETFNSNDKDFIHGQLFFLLCENFVFFFCENRASGSDLERYLIWLLTQVTKTVSNPHKMELNPQVNTSDKIDQIGDISSIRIGQRVEIENGKKKKTSKRRMAKLVGIGVAQAQQRLSGFLGSSAAAKSVLGEAPEGAEIDLVLRVTIVSVTKEEKQQFLQNVAASIKDTEGALDVEVTGKYGKINGDELILSYPALVEKRGYLFDLDSAKRALYAALAHFVAKKYCVLGK